MTELPTSFGKYYLTEKLATGGMAEIYLAKILGPGGFEKLLVIKQILPRLSGQRHFVDLFVAEAKTLVTLTHGNIVPVYELGVIDDTYFIAMDYIDGPTLYRLTETMARREATMEPAVAAWITARMLEGLDYAHRKGEGVIHRDLSPRNVMLSRDGDVKLVDFGIAVTLGDPGEGSEASSAPTGSFPYMSPEQVRREQLNAQTDLFSAGVLMWEMLTGRRLFARGDADATLAAVQGADIPRPSTVRAEIPAKLDDVVMRALERDRDKRWPSATDMLAPLNKYLYSLDATPGPRDVAALVARYCPPETRRLPTNVEAELAVPDKPVVAGPSTAVIPRGRPQRQKSFATNIDLKSILDNATPLLPFDAITDPTTTTDGEGSDVDASDAARRGDVERFGVDASDEPRRRDVQQSAVGTSDSTRPRDAEQSGVRSVRASRVDDVEPPKPLEMVNDSLRRPPSRFGLVLVAIGGLALGAAAIGVFFANRDRVLHDDIDAGVRRDAPAWMSRFDDAFVEADAAVAVDAGVPIDAPAPPRDAGRKIEPRVVADAGVAARGSATLQVGADPWGEIYVDGKAMGRTPRELKVSAGRHTIEIVFPAENPPRKQTFAVDLANGETKALQADFN